MDYFFVNFTFFASKNAKHFSHKVLDFLLFILASFAGEDKKLYSLRIYSCWVIMSLFAIPIHDFSA